jgi:hypothetical protein
LLLAGSGGLRAAGYLDKLLPILAGVLTGPYRTWVVAASIAAMVTGAGCGGGTASRPNLALQAKPPSAPSTRSIAPLAQLGIARVVAKLCVDATNKLEEDREADAPVVIERLMTDLARIRASSSWRARIDRYIRALRRELPVEHTVAVVASRNEEYPLKQLAAVREHQLRRAGQLLRVGACSASPL